MAKHPAATTTVRLRRSGRVVRPAPCRRATAVPARTERRPQRRAMPKMRAASWFGTDNGNQALTRPGQADPQGGKHARVKGRQQGLHRTGACRRDTACEAQRHGPVRAESAAHGRVLRAYDQWMPPRGRNPNRPNQALPHLARGVQHLNRSPSASNAAWTKCRYSIPSGIRCPVPAPAVVT